MCVANLADEAALRAQVALKHVAGGKLQQSHQVDGVLVLCDLEETKETREG